VPKRARSWKRRIQPRCGLKLAEPVLYSTHFLLVQFTLNASCHHDVKRKHQQNPLAVDLPGPSLHRLRGVWVTVPLSVGHLGDNSKGRRKE